MANKSNQSMEQILADIRSVIEQGGEQEGVLASPLDSAPNQQGDRRNKLAAADSLSPEELEGEPILLTNMVLNDGEVVDVSEMTQDEIEARFYKKIPPFNIAEDKETSNEQGPPVENEEHGGDVSVKELPKDEQELVSEDAKQEALKEPESADTERTELASSQAEEAENAQDVEETSTSRGKEPLDELDQTIALDQPEGNDSGSAEQPLAEVAPMHQTSAEAQQKEEVLLDEAKAKEGNVLPKAPKPEDLAVEETKFQEPAQEPVAAAAKNEVAEAQSQSTEVLLKIAEEPKSEAILQTQVNPEVKPNTKEIAQAMQIQEETLISEKVAAEASAELAKLAPKTQFQPHGADSLELLVREAVKPMLKEWLDQHLVELVRDIVAAEVKRLAQEK